MSQLMRATVKVKGKLAEFHTFPVPELCEKFCRRHGLSLEAFQKCQRKILNDSLVEGAPEIQKHVYVTDDESCMWPMSKWPDAKQFEHIDIYEFYKAIGWSYVRKRFI